MSLEDKVKELEARLASVEAVLAQVLQTAQVVAAVLPDGPPDPGKVK